MVLYMLALVASAPQAQQAAGAAGAGYYDPTAPVDYTQQFNSMVTSVMQLPSQMPAVSQLPQMLSNTLPVQQQVYEWMQQPMNQSPSVQAAVLSTLIA